MKVIFHVVDNYRRDLNWRLELAEKLKNLGYTNYIGLPEAIRKLHISHKNSLILGRLGSTTGNSKFDIEFINEIESNGSKLIYFHDEGGVFLKDDFEKSVFHTHPIKLINKFFVKKVFVWGDEQYNVLKNSINSTKLEVFGMPRLDTVYRLNKKSFDEKKFILINSRFGDVNKVDGDISFFDFRKLEIRKEGNEYLTHAEIKSDLIKEWCSSNISFSYFIEMIHHVITSFPNENFIIRPHPSESEEFYSDIFSSYNNVSVSKCGDLVDLFKHTKLVLHSQCTTGLESFFNNIPQINYVPINDSNFVLTCVSELKPIATDLKSISDMINVILDGDNYEEIDTCNMKKYIANVDNSFSSHKLIIDEVINVFEGVETRKIFKLNWFVLKYYIKKLLFSLNFKSISSTSRLYWPKIHDIDIELKAKITKFGFNFYKI